jgi:hypothetical protein
VTRADPLTPSDPGVRRLALTAISLDIVIALRSDPDGLRLTQIAGAIGSPVSSVQAALRSLVQHGLAERVGPVPPRYRLTDHPAATPLERLALLLPEPAHVIGIVLRADPDVVYATVDRAGFVVGLEDGDRADGGTRLGEALSTVRGSRPDAPPVDISSMEELRRMLRVSLGLRARLDDAVAVKGRVGARGEAPYATSGEVAATPRRS